MTHRHRFVGRVGDPCGEMFGGVARCALSFGASFHYGDMQHPFQGEADRPGVCAWVLQNTGHEQHMTMTCGQPSEASVHTLAEEVFGAPPTVVLPVSANVGESNSNSIGNKEWGKGHVYPPDEDAVGTRVLEIVRPGSVAPNLEGLAREAQDYAWQSPEAVRSAMAEEPGDTQPEWSRACQWLREEGVGLVYGPWPVRKFYLPDMPSAGDAGDEHLYGETLASLDALGTDYVVQVWRPDGRSWRLALVTWDWAYGLGIEVICDEMASLYDRS